MSYVRVPEDLKRLAPREGCVFDNEGGVVRETIFTGCWPSAN